eukprot:TRINITY_DN3908_c0_g2_i2.p1 TRINITY_DN3908_c0_g2~~TRINITY_DN3908_c0_g2_i2.p1  ORF type:complete len:210 (+),score=63.78 TRINITY_DN3908_c0_g2_i2:112-741(+)
MATMATPAQKRDFDYLFKIVVIGDSGVGKSNLLLRFADDTFIDSYITTIGVDFRFRTVHINQKAVKLQIWDTAGQDRYRTINAAFYRHANGVILVYDVTNRETFDHVEGWLKEALQYSDANIQILIIGNKADLPDHQVTEEMGQQLAEKLGRVPFMITSAKNATNVDTAFMMMAQQLVESRKDEPPPPVAKPNLNLSNENPPSSNCPCS